MRGFRAHVKAEISMSENLLFTIAEDGFVAEIDGYMCYVIPEYHAPLILWKWEVTSGGGWTFRRGDFVTHASGHASKTQEAQEKIVEALQDLNVDV